MTPAEAEHLRRWIGRTSDAEDIVTRHLVDGFRATLEPHLAPIADDEAPHLIHWCLAPGAAPMDALGEDGHPAKGGFLPPVPLPRRMWAGGEVRGTAPLRIGDRVTRHTTITDVAVKDGRTGPLCFVTLEHEIATARGVAVRERQDLVYRGPAAGAPPQAGETEEPDLAWTVEASPVLLFRYSALTFNGHRIHYDRPYAQAVEGYPGLVVHGPLQATLLFHLAAVRAGRPPARFGYRAVAPLIDGQAFRIGIRRRAEGDAEGWVRDAAGRVTMKATAAW
jgi:3-methylfumaryl-CoA hydratase